MNLIRSLARKRCNWRLPETNPKCSRTLLTNWGRCIHSCSKNFWILTMRFKSVTKQWSNNNKSYLQKKDKCKSWPEINPILNRAWLTRIILSKNKIWSLKSWKSNLIVLLTTKIHKTTWSVDSEKKWKIIRHKFLMFMGWEIGQRSVLTTTTVAICSPSKAIGWLLSRRNLIGQCQSKESHQMTEKHFTSENDYEKMRDKGVLNDLIHLLVTDKTDKSCWKTKICTF